MPGGHCRELRNAAKQTLQVGGRASQGKVTDKFQPIEIQNVQLAGIPKDEIGLLEITVREAIVVQPCDQLRCLPHHCHVWRPAAA